MRSQVIPVTPFDPLPADALRNPPRGSAESGSRVTPRGRVESGSRLPDHLFIPRSTVAESGSGEAFEPLRQLIRETHSGLRPESGSMLDELEEYDWPLTIQHGSGQQVVESGSGEIESGSGLFGGRFFQSEAPESGAIAPAPRSRTAPRADARPLAPPHAAAPAPRYDSRLGGGFDPLDLPPPTEAGPPPGDSRVHALLVSLGWFAALAAGGLGGYLLATSRGGERRRRSLEPRQLDLAGEIAETADSLMAAADGEEAGRLQACVERLRERAGRTAVLLDDRSAGAVRDLISAATTGPPSEPTAARTARLQTSYDKLVAALRQSVRADS